MINILQLGENNFNTVYSFPEYLNIECAEKFVNVTKTMYDLVFVDRGLDDVEVELLYNVTKAYTLYVLDDIQLSESMKQYILCNKGKYIKRNDVQTFLCNEAKNYFAKPYGEKMGLSNFAVAQAFKGSVAWNGNYSIELDGDYGEKFRQIIYLRHNIVVNKGTAIELWLEYNKSENVEIQIEVTMYRRGDTSTVLNKWIFDENQLSELIIIDNDIADGNIFVSIGAKGSGQFKMIALHDRISRRGHGCFLPGGERKVFSNREELFYYFDPGNMKPPLNVYFSGYKTMQGFEGYFMMKKMGSPFLLIAEPRLEGGAFYMGNSEYEEGVVEVIRKFMDELKFSSEHVILAGLSMGTFGALYYGCDILPYAIILGKPLANVGDIATNERLHRPGGFPTSLDVVNYMYGNIENEAIKAANNRFWNKFDAVPWKNTRFAVAYMIEDDYDRNAYSNLISHLNGDGVKIYGKGIHGRHNDASGAIVSWFKTQYNNILEEMSLDTKGIDK